LFPNKLILILAVSC